MAFDCKVPNVKDRRARPVTALRSVKRFNIVNRFQFRTNVTLFVRVVIIGNSGQIRIPMLQACGPFTMRGKRLIRVLPLMLRLRGKRSVNMIVNRKEIYARNISYRFSFCVNVFCACPYFCLPKFSREYVRHCVSNISVLVMSRIVIR